MQIRNLKLALIFALLPSLAWATSYTSQATGNWNSTSTWSPSGTPSASDTVILANGFTVTIPAGYTAATAGVSCSSAAGTGILIVNGTLEQEGTVNQCNATWQLNPQSAAATATGSLTRGSSTVTLSSITGSVAVGQLVWPSDTTGGIYGATFVTGISGSTLTMSQNAFKTASAGLSFFPPSILFNSATSYVWNIGYQNGGSSGPYPLLQINGTATAPIGITTATGSANFGGFSPSATYQMSGMIQGAWANINNCGTSSADCWYPYYFFYGNGLATSASYFWFDQSGRIDAYLSQNSGSISYACTNCSFTSPLNSSGISLDVTVNSPVTFTAGNVSNNYFEGQFKVDQANGSDYGQDAGLIANGNFGIGTSSVAPFSGGTVGFAAGHFDANALMNQLTGSAGSSYPNGSITRDICLLSGNMSGAATHLVCGGPGSYANTDLNGVLVEREWNDGSGYQGASSCLVVSGSTFATSLEGMVAVPSPAGYSPCAAIDQVGTPSSGQQVTATHNTVLATPTANSFGAILGEGSSGVTNLFPAIESNIIWMTSGTSGTGYGTFWTGGTPVSGAFGTVDYQDFYNVTGSPYTSKYGGSSSWYASTPGTHDLAANPNFLDATRNLGTWATAQGLTWSTWADIVSYGFRCMNAPVGCPFNPASILSEYYWVRTGFSPTNAALQGTAPAGYTPAGSSFAMQDIGAMPYMYPAQSPPQFSGLLTSTTDLTPGYTTPTLPTSGTSSYDSTFNSTASRIPAPTTCEVVSTYNPSGDCAITQNYLNVDYSKVVPWSVDLNYYVATEQAQWIYIYTRSSGDVYSFLRLVNTANTSYGSVRDNAQGFGLAGDQSNWLLANNASSNPDTIYYTGSTIASSNRTQLKAYNVATDTLTLVHDFASTIATVNGWGDCAVTATAIDMQREGNQSDDDRYWAFGVTDGTSEHWCAALVYDKTTDTVIALKTFGANGMCGVPSCDSLHPGNGYPNWLGMSMSGLYMVLNWQAGTYINTWTPHEGTEIYTRTLGYVGVASANNGHGDVGYDANGLEIYVDTSSSISPQGNYAFEACNIALANGNPGAGGCTRNLTIPCTWANSTCPVGSNVRSNDYFISMRGTHSNALGWMLLSTQTGGGAGYGSIMGNGGWGALENDAVLFNWASGSIDVLAGVPPATSITRLGRNHAIFVYDSGGDNIYGFQANAAPDRNFDRYAWTSSWDAVPTSTCPATCSTPYLNLTTVLGSSPPPPPSTTGVSGATLFGVTIQ